MDIVKNGTSCQHDADIAEMVYDSLLGQLVPEYHLSWVENIFVPGHPCHDSYHQMRVAYSHLLERLKEEDEDDDAERMIMHLLEYSRTVAYEMFKYGRKYQKMQDAE